MATVTSLLVSYPGGWHWEVDDTAPLRIEATLGLTVQTLTEVVRLAQAELATYGQGQEEITVGTDPDATPVGGLTPSLTLLPSTTLLPSAGVPAPKAGRDYDIGDEVTVDGVVRVVESILFDVDDVTGRLVRIPRFGTIFDTPARRAQRVAERHQIGSLNGTSRLATPVATVPGRDPLGADSGGG